MGTPSPEVNRGLNCVKGYFLSKIMYGEDRLTKPLLRKRDGVYDKEGDFEPVSWDEAFDIMAEKWKKTLKDKGPKGIGMFGSGQWTVWEGYAASKLMKAGFRSNNIDPNARHCMASAVGGFIRTFGIDEPMGCYDDFENADAFVLWGSNMAEMHPILWTRVADRAFSHPHVKVAVLSTFKHRSFDLADIPMVFTPQTDMVILNYIANYLIENDAVNHDFVSKHVRFKRGNDDIGYGLRPEHPLEVAAKNNDKAGGATDIDFKAFAEFVKPYTLEKASEMSGVPASRLEALAKLYADPKVRVMSLWTMGVNQHTRGVWVNNMIYNIHLLTGKISTPGNSPFSLTGQPSACGTAREVGTFAHRLPADLVVANPKHRATAREDLEAARGHDSGQGRRPCGAAEPVAQGRQDQLLLGAGEQQYAGRPQHDGGGLSRLSQSGQFHRRLRCLSDGHGGGRGPYPADRNVGREGRRLRQCRTAHAILAPAGGRTGRKQIGPLATGGVFKTLQGRGSLAQAADRQETRARRANPL